jgi:hypothetical protein
MKLRKKSTVWTMRWPAGGGATTAASSRSRSPDTTSSRTVPWGSLSRALVNTDAPTYAQNSGQGRAEQRSGTNYPSFCASFRFLQLVPIWWDPVNKKLITVRSKENQAVFLAGHLKKTSGKRIRWYGVVQIKKQ